MNDNKKEKDEYLEHLWEMKERNQDSLDYLKNRMNESFESGILEELEIEGLINYSVKDQKASLTENGSNQARKIIRAHRIGERLLYDVFGGEFEKGACEFEHTYTVEIVDGICTLLGHPKECPHGMKIPEGECCRISAKSTHNLVTPLSELEIGGSARVAYINSKDDDRLHRLNGLQIRPGKIIKLHQRYPCYVVECENASIALDDDIASNICIWHSPKVDNDSNNTVKLEKKHKNWWNKIINI